MNKLASVLATLTRKSKGQGGKGKGTRKHGRMSRRSPAHARYNAEDRARKNKAKRLRKAIKLSEGRDLQAVRILAAM